MHTALTRNRATHDFQRFHTAIWRALGCDTAYAVDASGTELSFEIPTGTEDLSVTVAQSPAGGAGVATVRVRVGSESVLTYSVPVTPPSAAQFVQRLNHVLGVARPGSIEPQAPRPDVSAPPSSAVAGHAYGVGGRGSAQWLHDRTADPCSPAHR